VEFRIYIQILDIKARTSWSFKHHL